MRFQPTAEQEMLRSSARAFLTDACPLTRVRAVMESPAGRDPELWRAMAELGWCGLVLPEGAGGSGLGPVELVLLMEELGRALAPVPLLSTMLGGWCMSRGGVRGERLAALASGREIATLAWMEGPAWDLAAVGTTAHAAGGVTRLQGQKRFVADAGVADWLIVSARDRGELGLWIVDCRAPGVTVTPLETIDETRRVADVRLDAVAVEPGDRLDGGAPLLAAVLDLGRVALAAELVGTAARVLDMSVEYACTRVQFGGPIGRFQAVQHRLVGMCVETEAARSLVHAAACRLQNGHPEARLAAAIAKAAASEACPRVACDGIQVHGGIGFTWEHDLHLYLRRAKADEFAFGDAEASREDVATALAAGVAEENQYAG